MGGYCAHFLFDTFRTILRKGAFLYSFFINNAWDKHCHFGPACPKTYPAVVPLPLHFDSLFPKNRNGGTPYG